MTSRQRTFLKSLAHPLKATVHVGKEGVTATAVEGVRQALATRELLKIKVLEHAPQSARETGQALADGIDGAEVVQVIGRTIVLYRPHPDTPQIRLPH
jgi:RNA-binding protein